MPDPISATIIGTAVVGGVIQNKSAKSAAKAQIQAGETAAESTAESTRLGIEQHAPEDVPAQKLQTGFPQSGRSQP